jgi:uncharacterized membrane protein
MKTSILEQVKSCSGVATILSVGGALLVTSPDTFIRLTGYITWLVSNSIWMYYFKKTNQFNPMLLFLIYLIITIIGIYNNI